VTRGFRPGPSQACRCNGSLVPAVFLLRRTARSAHYLLVANDLKVIAIRGRTPEELAYDTAGYS